MLESLENGHPFTTNNVHSGRRLRSEHGAIHKPIHSSVQYCFDDVQDLIGVFQGTRAKGFQYARQGTPTSAALEDKVTALEDGIGTVCFASGMAAIAAVMFTLLRAGDHMVSSKFIFGNTNSLLDTLQAFGVEIDRVDACSGDAVAAAMRPNTRMVFVETIANPRTQVADLQAIGKLCRSRGVLLVVDNTITSPVIFRPKAIGAGLVVNSLTKTIAGHGDALGGAVTDTGEYDWRNYPNVAKAYRKGDAKRWGLVQIRKKGLRDMGASLAPEQAHRISVGAETLLMRVERTSASALALASWLEGHSAVSRVHYPFLESHPQYGRAKELFRAGSWLFSFELEDPTRLIDTINSLQIALKATGLGDTRTLVIPVAQTIFWEAGPEARAAMGISEGLVRVSVGLEAVPDLMADFESALKH